MSDISLEFDITSTLEKLDDLEDRWVEDSDWVVGTNVFYSVFLEFGTKHMDPRPFFRPALAEMRAQGVEDFITSNSRLEDAGDTSSEVVRNLAFTLERRIKEIITKKGLIDTGTLRISVAAIPGDDANALTTKAEARALANEGASTFRELRLSQ